MRSIFVLLYSTILIAQQNAPRKSLVEIFTSITCSACTVVEPEWYSVVYEPLKSDMVVVAYHTRIPAPGDPFYSSASSDVDAIMSFYGINFTPAGRLDGVAYGSGSSQGHLAFITPGRVEQHVAQGSPIKITVRDSMLSPGNYRVFVKIDVVNNPPAGSYVLKVAAVERFRFHTWLVGSPPPNKVSHVFRGFITSPNGKPIILPTPGNSIIDSFDYSINTGVTPPWKASELYIAAWVQNTTTKEVLNAEQTIIYKSDAIASNTSTTSSRTFLTIENTGTTPVEITVELDSGRYSFPSSWTVSYSVGSTTANAPDILITTIPSGISSSLDIALSPYGSYGKGKGIFVVRKGPDKRPLAEFSMVALAGITDIVVNNEANENLYIGRFKSAFNLAGRSTFAVLTNFEFASFTKQNIDLRAQDGLNIYYNGTWNVPAIPEHFALYFMNWLDNGGRLFICGQDIGWDVWDPNGNSTADTVRYFYTHYLNAKYINDVVPGVNPNNNIFAQTRAKPTDSVFGNLASYGLITIDAPYRSDHQDYYPEAIKPINIGMPILEYFVNGVRLDTIFAGVRAFNGKYKTVYLGVGVEMFQDSVFAVNLIKTAHDWFWQDLPSSTEDLERDEDIQILNLKDNLLITLSRYGTWQLTIFDLTGKEILSKRLDGKKQEIINIEGLESGIYFLSVSNAHKKFIIKFVK
ncbi:MAG: T9SS type A sorting domain-containing protein [Chlorobi bacterium]|nr:T9SS type A sorting domain-containing protein [Chlorobiota bacterium]